VRLSKPESNGALKNLEGVADAREVGGAYVLHSMRPPQAIVSLVKHLESEGNELVSLEIATPLSKTSSSNDRKEATRLKNFVALTRMRIRLAMRNKMFFFFLIVMPFAFFFLWLGVIAKGAPQVARFISAPSSRLM